VEISSNLAANMGGDPSRAEEHTKFLEEKDPICGARARSALISEKKTMDLWEKILEEHQDVARAHAEAARIFIPLGEIERARNCVDKALEIDRESNYILLNLATAYASAKQWKKAKDTIERYLEYDPPVALKAFAYARLGLIERGMGNEEKGEELLKRAREMDRHVWITFMPPPEEIFTPL
jgi:tetratricopeptide (TPR) repeat protein